MQSNTTPPSPVLQKLLKTWTKNAKQTFFMCIFSWVFENAVTAVVGGAGEVFLEMAISRLGKRS